MTDDMGEMLDDIYYEWLAEYHPNDYGRFPSSFGLEHDDLDALELSDTQRAWLEAYITLRDAS